MKSLFNIHAIVLIILVSADISPAQPQTNQKNPFAPLDKIATPKLPGSARGELLPFDSEQSLMTQVFKLNFAEADSIERTVRNLLSKDGKAGTDDRLNCVVVSDTAANLERIGKAIERLDVKAPQVMIEALIVNVKLTEELKMGIDWTALGKTDTITDTLFTQDLSATTGANPFGQISFSKVTGDWTFTGLLDFVQTNEDVRILANPKVLVLNNHKAIINSVEEIPYQELSETSEGGSIGTVAFKEAGVKLEVTPQITDDGYIIMHIKPEQSAQIGTFTIENSDTPVIEKRNADTTLRVKDGQTIIIGGLRKSEPSVVESKIPILGDIPLIGLLFRKVDTNLIESELGVFITPHIYTDGKLTDDEIKLIEKGTEKKSLYKASDLLRLEPHDDINN